MSLVRDHFATRAPRYDRSSHWVADPALAKRVLQALAPRPTDDVLDVACGTGLVAKTLRDHVKRIVGIDFCPEMTTRAPSCFDELIHADAESMPLDDNQFDIVVCRQGIQFMNADQAVAEMVRVTRPGGKICLVQLCAYGPEDQAEYFEILRLRNPARCNFFLPKDVSELLRRSGCATVRAVHYVSRENVDVWSNHGAIDEEAREQIRAAYRRASPTFRELHAVEQDDHRVVDNMLFVVAIGIK